jgi:hypothetical protein
MYDLLLYLSKCVKTGLRNCVTCRKVTWKAYQKKQTRPHYPGTDCQYHCRLLLLEYTLIIVLLYMQFRKLRSTQITVNVPIYSSVLLINIVTVLLCPPCIALSFSMSHGINFCVHHVLLSVSPQVTVPTSWMFGLLLRFSNKIQRGPNSEIISHIWKLHNFILHPILKWFISSN